MDFAGTYISAPVRAAIGTVTSLPVLRRVSVYELLIIAAAVGLAVFIARAVIAAVRSERRGEVLLRRALVLAAVVLSMVCAYNWLWGSVYRATSFAERNGIEVSGVTEDDLYSAARHYAEMTNSLSATVERDYGGRFSTGSDEIIAACATLYDNIKREYSGLDARILSPKPMIFSKAMSYMGFTGVYFALTGEANVSTDSPAAFLPATIAHELAHMQGVAQEGEANFVGVAACITSDIPVYRYSGYLSGLVHLLGALREADYDAWQEIYRSLNSEVYGDLRENYEFWTAATPDNAVTAAVTSTYDVYLKSNGQQSGIKSYGECVDLLVARHAG